jgi:hypothetical protein
MELLRWCFNLRVQLASVFVIETPSHCKGKDEGAYPKCVASSVAQVG